MQFTNSNLEKLVKNLTDDDLKYLTEDFGSKHLQLLKQEDAYPYDYMNSSQRFSEKKLPDKNTGKVETADDMVNFLYFLRKIQKDPYKKKRFKKKVMNKKRFSQ